MTDVSTNYTAESTVVRNLLRGLERMNSYDQGKNERLIDQRGDEHPLSFWQMLLAVVTGILLGFSALWLIAIQILGGI